MNQIAQDLTGWDMEAGRGRPRSVVFRIINKQTREVVESPVEMVLGSGRIVGLANHTVLITRNGKELPIDDSGAPISAVLRSEPLTLPLGSANDIFASK